MRLIPSLITAFLSMPLALPVSAANGSGAYLAARHASFESDYVAAAEYYTQALTRDPGNLRLMEALITAQVNRGAAEKAVPVARHMRDGGARSQIAAMVLLASAAADGRFDEIATLLADDGSVGPLVDGLALAWADLGAGDVSAAMAAFDRVSDETGLGSFGHFHKALAFASVGDFAAADDILSGRAEGPLQVARRGLMAHAQVLSQLERNDDALELLDATLGASPPSDFAVLAERLRAGEAVPFDVVQSAAQGIGEVLYGVGQALSGEAAPGYTLLYTRLAAFLHPANTDAHLMSATLLEEMEQFDLATAAYDAVPADHPAFVAAELGRADALREAGRADAAVEALRQLSRGHPDDRDVHRQLGDALRALDRHGEATPAYDRAIALIETPEPSDWPLYFARGITLERTDRWEAAEADFEKALELNPDQPQVLNYLGYSLVEMHTKLDEALDMIERAVAARPDDGYITDSLGWVMFRLGRYDEAVAHMERAVELMPVDPIINDHLGDVYWAVGREMEARFQWKRALSFDPEPEEEERIRRKLEVGLDAVLAEEGAPSLDIARDDG